MKWSLRAAIFFLAACGGVAGAEEADPLKRQVRLPRAYVTFDEALEQLEKATTLSVICPEDIARLMRPLWNPKNFPRITQDALVDESRLAKKLLDDVCGDLHLSWKYDPLKRAVTLDLPWRKSDARSTADLFQIIWQPGHEDAFYKDNTWWSALYGLLSKPENFGAASKVQQAAGLQDLFRGFAPGWDATKIKPSLGKIYEMPVVSVTGDRYHCLFLVRHMQMSPGHGWMAYYWFKDDGTLAGADLMNTGHRLIVDHLQVRNSSKEGPSEMLITTEHNNQGTPHPVRFVLTERGFQLSEDSGLGQSLITPMR